MDILNKDSLDYGSLASAKLKDPPRALCSSNKCCTYPIVRRGRKTTVRKSFVTKYVAFTVDKCPDCGCALLWRST